MLMMKAKEVPDDLVQFFRPAGQARGTNCAEHDWENGCHVCRMVLVLREGRRVLRDDGTLWLNYGDSYGGAQGPRSASSGLGRDGRTEEARQSLIEHRRERSPQGKSPTKSLPSGNLVGIPWRVALALQADGWVLRQDIIWYKPSPMPESVRNRCTKAHEYVFLLTKSNRYYCDMEAIKSPATESHLNRQKGMYHYNDEEGREAAKANMILGSREIYTSNKRSVWTVDDERAIVDWLAENNPEILADYLRQSGNKSDVWRIASQGYPGTHFATFPPRLIEPCILAGTSEKGSCAKCGAPWKRVVEERKLTRERPNEYVKYADTSHEKKQNTPGKTPQNGWDALRAKDKAQRKEGVNSCSNSVAGRERSETGNGVEVETVGWEPTCRCECGEIRPCVVLDPFIGSGTTCVVSLEHGRFSIGIDLSEDYLRFNAVPRIEGIMLGTPYLRALLPIREIMKRGHPIGTPKPE